MKLTLLLTISLAVLLFWVSNLPSRQVVLSAAEENPHHQVFDNFDWDTSYSRLAQSLKLKTVSHVRGNMSYPENFLAFHKYLQQHYPLIHTLLKREVVNTYSLLFTWEGEDPSLPAVVLMNHYDVVPIAEPTLDQWEYEPFAGRITEEHIYGRGSMDVKAGVLALLEAVELTLQQGKRPTRTFYIMFGHDEEVGGYEGIVKIVELLQQRGVKVDFVLDEGGCITRGIVPNIPKDQQIAVVAIGEKGYVELEMTVNGEGGHSSMPPRETPIGILGKAIHTLESNQFPIRPEGVNRFFEFIGPHMPFYIRMVVGFRLSGIVHKAMEASNAGNAQLRTTIAPTIIHGGVKSNVLPDKVTAIVNFRIAPGDTPTSVLEYAKKVVNDDRVNISIQGDHFQDPSPLSPTDTPQFYLLQKTLKQVFPTTLVTPNISPGATDARHLYVLTPNVFRFVPYVIGPTDVHRFHGINERISKVDYRGCIKFYYQLIINLQQLKN